MKVPVRIIHKDRTATERCDTCDARAYVVVAHKEDVTLRLTFCMHHYSLLETMLLIRGWFIDIDDRPLLDAHV
jgi:hypothetical protein